MLTLVSNLESVVLVDVWNLFQVGKMCKRDSLHRWFCLLHLLSELCERPQSCHRNSLLKLSDVGRTCVQTDGDIDYRDPLGELESRVLDLGDRVRIFSPTHTNKVGLRLPCSLPASQPIMQRHRKLQLGRDQQLSILKLPRRIYSMLCYRKTTVVKYETNMVNERRRTASGGAPHFKGWGKKIFGDVWEIFDQNSQHATYSGL